MNVATTPQTTSAPATVEATQEATLDAGLPADALEAAGKVPETAAAPAEGEVAAETPPAETADKVTVAAETLKKARKIAKARREAEAKAERERLRAEQFSQRAEQERREGERTRAELEAFKKDPLGTIKTLGVSARALAEKAIAEGTPEAKFAALEAAHAERTASLEAKIETLQKSIEAKEQSNRESSAREQFFSIIKPETHPRLHTMDRDIVLSMARTAFDKARARGHSPSDKQVLDYVETLLSPQGASAGTPTPKTNPGTTVAKPVAKPSPASRTVTADLSSKRYTAPANIEDLDLNSQKEALARMLEEAE